MKTAHVPILTRPSPHRSPRRCRWRWLQAIIASCAILVLGAGTAHPAAAQGPATIEQVGADGGELVGMAWGPPLVAAHGRRLDVYAVPRTPADTPIGSLRTAHRILHVAASDGRAYVVASDDGRHVLELGVDLSDPHRPSILFQRVGGTMPTAIALSGEHLGRAEPGGAVVPARWPHGARPEPGFAVGLDLDAEGPITGLQARGGYAVASVDRSDAEGDRNLALAVGEDDRVSAVAEIPNGTPMLADDWVVVHREQYAIWFAETNTLVDGGWSEPARRWEPPLGERVGGVAIVEDLLWVFLGPTGGGGRVPLELHVVLWSLETQRRGADVPTNALCGDPLAVRPGHGGWLLCRAGTRVAVFALGDGPPAAVHGWWLPLRTTVYEQFEIALPWLMAPHVPTGSS